MEKKDYFGQKEMELALIEIKNQIEQSNFSPEIIFSINRGGCIPGVYLSHLLSIPHHVINVQLRDQKKNINISNLLEFAKLEKNILIVDDINDTGATFNFVKNSLAKYKGNFSYASLIENKSSNFKVDFKAKIIDKKINPNWIVFQWENLKQIELK
ncbi:MAG: hypothetical protein CBC28_01265 [Flavobacteriaceae bacterium TMED68]|nr:MAG: hypothetical protein CBC28_01265 [Flavobacteriaceae bacterium TMED68]|tara:strand:+ start:4413 stop:4880 length:468 start_codon:yes stop_codon:yes gene_type:complete